jgi:hypothetical protein
MQKLKKPRKSKHWYLTIFRTQKAISQKDMAFFMQLNS